MATPPNYRLATVAGENCKTCLFDDDGFCTKYRVDVDPQHVCDTWTLKNDTRQGGASQMQDYPESGEYRKDYPDAQRKEMAKNGHAMPDGSYPIADQEDLEDAIKAVGRGGASHDAIRKHIMANATRLNLSHLIPDNWNSDGSLKQSNGRWKNRKRSEPTPYAPEVRQYVIQGLELRDIGGSGDLVNVEGYFLRYGDEYEVMDMFGPFTERMASGVLSNVMDADCRFLVDHDPSKLLARTTSGTLKITDTADGGKMAATVDLRDSDARNLAVRMERGDINQMSCGFIVGRDEWNEEQDFRTIHRFQELLDVSAVTYPASPTTSLQIQQRMARRLSARPESEARLNRLYAELRAGKKMSAAHEGMLTDAVTSLHGLMSSAGVPIPGQAAPGYNDVDGDGDNDAIESQDGLGADFINDPGEENDQIRSANLEALRERSRRLAAKGRNNHLKAA